MRTIVTTTYLNESGSPFALHMVACEAPELEKMTIWPVIIPNPDDGEWDAPRADAIFRQKLGEDEEVQKIIDMLVWVRGWSVDYTEILAKAGTDLQDVVASIEEYTRKG